MCPALPWLPTTDNKATATETNVYEIIAFWKPNDNVEVEYERASAKTKQHLVKNNNQFSSVLFYLYENKSQRTSSPGSLQGGRRLTVTEKHNRHNEQFRDCGGKKL